MTSLLDRHAVLLDQLAMHHGVELRAVRALLEVEARGVGLTPAGPVIRLEVNKLWERVRPSQRREVDARFHVDGPRAWEGHRWLDGDRWVRLHQEIEDGGQILEHRALLCARAIDENAAISSTSWGCGQVMGEYWRELGYATPAAFAVGMEDEARQILAVFKHLDVISAAIPNLRARQWADVARKYNGSGNVAYYSKRMAAAYERLG